MSFSLFLSTIRTWQFVSLVTLPHLENVPSDPKGSLGQNLKTCLLFEWYLLFSFSPQFHICIPFFTFMHCMHTKFILENVLCTACLHSFSLLLYYYMKGLHFAKMTHTHTHTRWRQCHNLLYPSSFLHFPPSSPQEEDSPDGELRRAESSPTPLKRDRSFSEHDLAMLRGEMLPSLSESAQLGGAVRLRGERPRSRTLTGARPPPIYRGQYVNIKSVMTWPVQALKQCYSGVRFTQKT